MEFDLNYTAGELRENPENAIFLDILDAITTLSPGRRVRGDGYAYQTLFIQLAQMGKEYEIQQIILASESMRNAGFVEIRNEIFVHPTEPGELLIEKLFPLRAATNRPRPFPVKPIQPQQ